MRILHVISSMDPRQGGTSEAVLQLCREAVRTGHEVEIASIDAPGREWATSFPIPLHPLGPGTSAWQYSASFLTWLKNNVRRFDAVVAHALWQFTGVAVRQACAGQPYFVFPHGMLDPWFDQFPLKRLKKNLFWPWAEYRVLRDARSVFFTSEEERLGAHRSFRSLSAREIVTPLGIDDPPVATATMAEAFAAKVPHLAGRPFLLFLGRIHPKKGCDLLLAAWRKIAPQQPGLCLVMAGPDTTGWGATLPSPTDERVFWPGMLTGDAKWGALHNAEAFILPSHQENFGIAVAESLACSTPVLLSDKVNIWREITGAGGGFAEADSLAGTETLLRRFLALSIEEKNVFRQQARSCFHSHFRLSTAASTFHQHLARLIL